MGSRAELVAGDITHPGTPWRRVIARILGVLVGAGLAWGPVIGSMRSGHALADILWTPIYQALIGFVIIFGLFATIAKRPRPFGVGLLIGVLVGLVATVVLWFVG